MYKLCYNILIITSYIGKINRLNRLNLRGRGGMMNKENREKVLDILSKVYGGAKCGLDFTSPFELLISTILSAQCTDERVNIVTKELYKEYNTPEAIVTLTRRELGEKIRSCGFYKNKSKNILGCLQNAFTKTWRKSSKNYGRTYRTSWCRTKNCKCGVIKCLWNSSIAVRHSCV